MPRALKRSKLLPDCEGPKLHPFSQKPISIEFINLVSENDPVNLSAGGHAHVFEALIDSKTYALKVFKFYDDSEIREALSARQSKLFSVDLTRAHMDPFFNECRAYGKLIEKKFNGKVAVRCHGYLTLPAERESELTQRFSITAWNRPEDEYLKSPSKRQPLRAIVKDLVTKDVAFTKRTATKMLRDLIQIRKLGVYPLDIQARNYKGSLLVDFSVAMTEPHYLFVIKPRWRVEEDFKYDDLRSFDNMMEASGLKTWNKATRDEEFVRDLRPRDNEGKAVTKL